MKITSSVTLNKMHYYIYSFSEDKDKDFSRYNSFEKIGCSENVCMRLYDFNNSPQCLVPFECNWFTKINSFSIQFPTIESIEEAIHNKLQKFSVKIGAGTEWFSKAGLRSLEKAKEFLDENKILYEEHIGEIEEIPRTRIVVKEQGFKQKAINKIKEFLNLRGYQKKMFDIMLRENRATLCCPCGCGKTTVFIEFLKKTFENSSEERWLILAPEIALVEEILKKIKTQGLPAYKYGDNIPKKLKSFVIVSTYSSSKKFDNINFQGVIYDECHRVIINKENVKSEFQHCVKRYCPERSEVSNVKQFFFTATPKFHEDDEKMLSLDAEKYFGKVYDVLTEDDAIKEKCIVPYKGYNLFCDDDLHKKCEKIQYALTMTPIKKAIIFCSSQEEAENIYNFLKENVRDYLTVCTISKYKKEINHKSKDKFCKAEKALMCTCKMASTGFDHEAVDTVIFTTPPSSFIFNKQAMGRAQRPFSGKAHFNVVYIVQKFSHVRTIFKLFSQKFEYVDMLENVVEKSERNFEPGNGRFVCVAEDDSKKIEFTRDFINIFNSDLSEKERLRGMLRLYNKKFETSVYDARKIKEMYSDFFKNISNLLKTIKNIPEFALPPKIYERYLKSIEVEKDTIKKICIKEGINGMTEYKKFKHHKRAKLPNYEFILNGGIENIKNLNELFIEGDMFEN